MYPLYVLRWTRNVAACAVGMTIISLMLT